MIQAKPYSSAVPPAYHGAFDYAELAKLGMSPDEIIDFSVNSNPYGPPSAVREAIAQTPLDRYPDRECLALRAKLAEMHGIGVDQIVVGNGTAELLQLIAFAFLERGARVVIPESTFGEYERVAQLMGAEVSRLRWTPAEAHLLFDLEAKFTYLGDSLVTANLVFLCNPNNPDGSYFLPDWIARDWVKRNPNTLFVVDEAYANFLTEPQTIIDAHLPNVIVVRSLTKDYALAGLRLGYAVGQPEWIEAIRRVRPAWNVNALAQTGGAAALDQQDWLRMSVAQLHRDKTDLVRELRALGLKPLPSNVHFFLVNVSDGAAFRSKLLHHRIMVRDCASFGLPEYVRIATRTPQDNAQLLDAARLCL
jgi:histidinol-phosphate aminotransferase